MKKLYTIMLAALFAVPLFAQIPDKISYQAIVRDNNNSLIANSMIGLRISILQNNEAVYEETQTPVTNANGLISIEIGGGKGFNAINWADGPYFIKTEIDPSGGKNYTVTGVSQMLSVPYALHARSATYLTGDDGISLKAGIPSQTWSLFGNTTSNPRKDKLGTTDAADLVIVTNNIERMRILSDGNITMTSSLDVGENLSVDGATDLKNTLNVDGITDLNADFNVNNESPSLLTGTLTVNGATDLDNTLNVDGATDLKNTLNVDGITELNADFNVNNASPSLLTGTLTVNGATDLDNTLNVDGITNLNADFNVNNASPSLLTGTLTVNGATDLNNSLNVDGITNLNADFNVNNESPSLLTGTLTVDGATDLNSTLNVDGITNLNADFNVNNESPSLLTGTLTVDGATDLNSTLNVDGITNLNADFNVNNESPSLLTGTLTVNGATDLNNSLNVDGITDLNADFNVNNESPSLLTGTLTVDGATDLNSTLNVDGITDLNADFNVNNESPSLLTGTLTVNGATGLNNTLNVDGITDLNADFNVNNASPSLLTGKLTVNGATDLDNTLNVDGATDLNSTLNVDGITDLNADFNVNNESPSLLTGTLTVNGATDLDNTLNVDGITDLNAGFNVNNAGPVHLTGTLLVDGITDLNNTLNVDGITELKSALNVDGAADLNNTLNVDGATDLNNALNVDGATTINNTTGLNGQVTINANVGGGEASYGAYPLRVQGSDQGIAIKLNAGTPKNENNFITFFNSSGGAVGRIEGETAAEKVLTPEYVYENTMLIVEEAEKIVNVVLAAIPVVVGGLVVSAGPCGACLAMAAADLILATANIVAYNVFALLNLGVTYQSGSADYAEWLERSDPNEIISAGDIVGVYGGKISKYTLNAQQYMVISTKPAILGNMPMAGKEALFEKVAFMGQIPVKVRGIVMLGDYILPSGFNDGIGVAVSSQDITAKQYREIVGVAWSVALYEDGISVINMAIGLNTNDVANLAIQQEKKIQDLEKQFNSLAQRLLALEDGKGYSPNKVAAEVTSAGMKATPKKEMTKYEMFVTNVPAELSAEVMEDAMLYLENAYRDRGINIKDHPGLNKLFTDVAYKAEIIKKTQENYKKSYQSILKAAKNKN